MSALDDTIDLDAEGSNEPTPMVTLFKWQGVEHKIPANPRANMTLKALDLVEKYGPELGNMMMLKELLGPESFAVLKDNDQLTAKQLGQIVDLAYKVCFGQVEVNPGN